MLYYDEAASGHAEPTLWYLLMCMYVCLDHPREIPITPCWLVMYSLGNTL